MLPFSVFLYNPKLELLVWLLLFLFSVIIFLFHNWQKEINA